MFAVSIVKEIKGILKSINEQANNKHKHSQLLKKFVKFHDLHTDTKQLSHLKYLCPISFAKNCITMN